MISSQRVYDGNDFRDGTLRKVKGVELKNRGKVEILNDILSSALEGGAKKTHIMYRANLSSEQMRFYFQMLLSNKLLSTDRDNENNMIYKTTIKGIKFLQCCAQMKHLISTTGFQEQEENIEDK